MRIRIQALLVVGALAFSAVSSWAVELKLKWQPGKRYVFEHSSDYTAKMPLPGQGLMETKGKMVMTMNNDVSAHEKGVKVGTAFAGIRMRSEMQGLVMDYDSENPAKSGGILGPLLQPLADAKYDAIYNKDGTLLEMKGLDQVQAPGQMGIGKAELEAMARQSSKFLPKQDVKPGDTWQSDMELPMGALGGDLSIKYSFKLEAIEERKGRAIAKVSITGTMNDALEESGESVLNVEAKSVSGEMLFDIELGQPLELRTILDLEMVVPGPVEAGAPGKMPMKTLSVQKLLKVEDLPAKGAKASRNKEKKPAAPSEDPKPSATSRGETLTPEENKARRKARREKRKAEKAEKP